MKVNYKKTRIYDEIAEAAWRAQRHGQRVEDITLTEEESDQLDTELAELDNGYFEDSMILHGVTIRKETVKVSTDNAIPVADLDGLIP